MKLSNKSYDVQSEDLNAHLEINHTLSSTSKKERQHQTTKRFKNKFLDDPEVLESTTIGRSCENYQVDSRQLSTDLGRGADEAQYWKNNYLKLQKIHQMMVHQLNSQLEQKDIDILELEAKLKEAETIALSHFIDLKEIKQQDKNTNEQHRATTDQNNFSTHQADDYRTKSISNQKLEAEIQKMNFKIEELEILKSYSEMKEQQSSIQNIKLTKQLSLYKQKESIPKLQKGVNTDKIFQKSDKPIGSEEQLSINCLKSKLLRLMETNNKLTKQLQQDSQNRPLRGNIVGTACKFSSSVGVSKIEKKPLNLSKNLSLKTGITKGENSGRSQKSSEISTHMSKTFSGIICSNKSSITVSNVLKKDKWMSLKASLQQLKSQNKVLRNFMGMA